jgi:hypothetical protein
MSNNNISGLDYLISQLQKSKDWHRVLNEVSSMSTSTIDIIAEAKAIQNKQLQDYFKRGENNYKRGYKPITFKEFHDGYFGDGKD